MVEKIKNPTSEPFRTYGRMRFMRLEVAKAFQDGGKPRWEATQIIDPSSEQGQKDIKMLLDLAARMAKETYNVVPLALKKLKVTFVPGTPALDLNDPKNADDGIKIPFVSGDSPNYEKYNGYKGMFIMATHNAKLKPGVANALAQKISPGDPQYPYDGCFAWMSASLWVHATHGAYAKRVGANLRGVQFAKAGPAFTQDQVDAEDEFEPLAEDETPAPAAGNDGWD